MLVCKSVCRVVVWTDTCMQFGTTLLPQHLNMGGLHDQRQERVYQRATGRHCRLAQPESMNFSDGDWRLGILTGLLSGRPFYFFAFWAPTILPFVMLKMDMRPIGLLMVVVIVWPL